MAKILSDRDVKRTIGTLVSGADEKLLNPNGIELRLGGHVRFHSTGEEKKLDKGLFLRVTPGETVQISSMEELDFTEESVQRLFPDSMLMGLITPTTTMMREGITQVSTKIDAGFRGVLNWSLRNGSNKDLILGFGEPIFKLTLFLLDADEKPEHAYGERKKDHYQDSAGIARSRRSIPADISKAQLVGSSIEKVDPKKRLREAGYPFDHIGTELADLHGKWEVVSKDVMLLKDEFAKLDSRLSGKIEDETKSLLSKINDVPTMILQKVEVLLNERMLRAIGIAVTMAGFLAAGYMAFLASAPSSTQVYVFLAVAVVALLFTTLYPRISKR